MKVKQSTQTYNKDWLDGWRAVFKINKNIAQGIVEEFGEPQTALEIELYSLLDSG